MGQGDDFSLSVSDTDELRGCLSENVPSVTEYRSLHEGMHGSRRTELRVLVDTGM